MKRAFPNVLILAVCTAGAVAQERPSVRLTGDGFDPALRAALAAKRPDVVWRDEPGADYRVRLLSPPGGRPYPRTVEILVELGEGGPIVSGDGGRCRFREDLVERLERAVPLLGRVRRVDGGRHRLEVPDGVAVALDDRFEERRGRTPLDDPSRAAWRVRREEDGSFGLAGVPPDVDVALVVRRVPDRGGRVALSPADAPPAGTTRIAWRCGDVRGARELEFRGSFEIAGLPRGHDVEWEVRLPDGTRREGAQRVPLEGVGRIVVETPAIGYPLRLQLGDGSARPGRVEVYVDGRVEPEFPRAFDANGTLVLTVAPGPHEVRVVSEDPDLQPFVVRAVEAGFEPRVHFALDVAGRRGRSLLESPAFRALGQRILAARGWRSGTRGELPVAPLATWHAYWSALPAPEREACVPLWIEYLLGDYARLESDPTSDAGPETALEADLQQAEGLIFLSSLLTGADDDGGTTRARAALVHLHLMRLLFEESTSGGEPVERYDRPAGLAGFAAAWDARGQRIVGEVWSRLLERRPPHAGRDRAVLLRALALQAHFAQAAEEPFGVEVALEWRTRSRALARLRATSGIGGEETTWCGRLMAPLPAHLRHPAFLPFE